MSKPKFEILDTVIHRDLRVDTQDFSSEANQTNTAQVVISEVKTLANEYPLFVIKHPSSGDFMLIALLGFGKNENLFLDGKRWRGNYIPLEVLRRPFHAYLPEGDMLQDGQIAIDRSATNLQGTYGEAIFDDEGQPTKYLKHIQSIFRELMDRTEDTKHVLKRLDETGLLESITIQSPDNPEQNISGLYGINEDKLSSLTDEEAIISYKEQLMPFAILIANSKLHLEKLNIWKHKQPENFSIN